MADSDCYGGNDGKIKSPLDKVVLLGDSDSDSEYLDTGKDYEKAWILLKYPPVFQTVKWAEKTSEVLES